MNNLESKFEASKVTDFSDEKLRHILMYIAYAERCAFNKVIPLLFKEWQKQVFY